MTKAAHGDVIGRPLPHESAHLHVSGEARYIDDLPEPVGTLHAAIGMSRHAHARLKAMDLSAVCSASGVVAVLTAEDIPGANNVGGMLKEEPILADGLVEYVGQSLFAVAATTTELARRAVAKASVEYATLEPVLGISEAVREASFILPTTTLARGDPARAIANAPHRLSGRLQTGGQDHFYLEGQVAFALPQEDGTLLVHSSTQHPGEVQMVVAHALGLQAKDVTVQCRRMGGGFGGKESQAALFACVAALLAARTSRPVKLRLDRDADMIMTGKRHDFVIDYEVGFADDGEIQGVDFTLASRCGMSADLSGPVNDRAMFHVDNCYYLDNVSITSHRCKTHTVSNTAFRGFGGPQGMMAIEQVLDEIARYLGLDALDVRKRNLYGTADRNLTPYGMQVEDSKLLKIIPRLARTARYRSRRRAIEKFNAKSRYLKRGIALTPVKFGISFTATHFNQAGALISVYTDGTIQLNHGGTEMGQGLFTKVAQVVAKELGVDIGQIRSTAADTGKVPNASATAASAGTDLNGMAALAAARTIRKRLARFAALEYAVPEREIEFCDGEVHAGSERISFGELARKAWLARVSLSAAGFYRTPRIHYDRATMSGRPFFYFAYGAAVSEVEIDTLTGEHRLRQVDILHDVGNSINPAIDLGQVEGGFIQGMGWLTTEELYWDETGALQTHAPSTYKIPVAGDLPERFNVKLLASSRNKAPTIHRSKAVGEPPLMLAMSVFYAIKDAVAAVADHKQSPPLNAPATPEAVLMAVEALQSGHSAKAVK